MIKNIVFDIGNVLVRFQPDEKDFAAAVGFYNGLTEQPVFLK